jgi:hypothetical protein
VTASLITAPEFAAFAKQLRGVTNVTFRRLAQRRLKAIADEAAAAAREAALAIPSKGLRTGQRRDARGRFVRSTGKPALRPLIAAAVATQLRTTGKQTGVSVTVRGARLPPDRRGAVKTVEFGGRHRVYGKAWVDQAATPFWRDAIRPYREKALLELSLLVDDLAHEAGFR